MAYNKYLGFSLHLLSILSFLYSFSIVWRLSVSVWAENVWMLPVFLFGVIAIPYVGYSVRSYGEVAWKMLVLKIFTPKYQDVFDKHTYESIVLPSDCDVFNHMNNSRYSREADFARVRFYVDTGLMDYFQEKKSHWIMTATVVRYRRSLEVFQAFRVQTRLMYWKDDNVYVEHRFITENNNTDFVNAIILSQMRILGKGNADRVLCEFLKSPTPPERPRLTEELRHFLNHIETSRSNLRKDR